MTILIAAATQAELTLLIEALSAQDKAAKSETNPFVYVYGSLHIEFLITGVGAMATAVALMRRAGLLPRPDFILQIGIGGSYDRDLPLGTVVCVESEVAGDLGAEDHYNFLDAVSLGLVLPEDGPYTGGRMINPFSGAAQLVQLPVVSGITVQTATGSAYTAETRRRHWGATVESMEGAALHYVCLQENIDFAQVRAVSNYVEPRNRAGWEIGLALQALRTWTLHYLDRLAETAP